MKRLTNTAVLLTIAAALATTVISCSSDDYLTEQPAEQPTAEQQTVHVTVGAGFADDNNGSGTPSTRSAVVTDGTARKLTFTAGDRLYVRGEITETSPQKIVAGYLDIVGTLASGATTATFSGDLSVYEYNSSTAAYENSSHTFTTDDPLSECSYADGVYADGVFLVHKDAVGFFVDDEKYGEYTPTTASSVDALMTQSLLVYGVYNSLGKQFILNVYDDTQYCTPIFNCIISGLKPNTTYGVTHIYKTNFENAIDGHGFGLGAVTSDADGKATFACYGVCKKAENYHILNFISSDKSDDRNVYLGTKALTSKVYNIGTAASPREALKFQEAKFSVDTDKKVYFSKGNLYAFSGGSGWEWYFQSHQWKYVGNASGNISMTSSWVQVDLFGWNGTSSSYDNYGISSSTTNADYGSTKGESLKHDWGHNAIVNGGNTADTWRTLTKDEWTYIFNSRTVTNSLNDGARYTMATIGGTYKGIILFPDNYTHPSGTGYTAGTYNAASNYTTAVTFEFWMQMENAGCVFLPAAGKRNGTTVDGLGSSAGGRYWSSTPTPSDGTYDAYYLYFFNGGVNPANDNYRFYGFSVRLVRDVE